MGAQSEPRSAKACTQSTHYPHYIITQPQRCAARLYLSPMKVDSPLMSPSAGLRKLAGRRASQYALARRFPICCTKTTCSGSQVSSVVDLTLLQCTPSERCTPEQLRQMKQPRLTDAHVGPRAPQSAQRLLSSCFSSACSTRRWLSFCALDTADLWFCIALPGVPARSCQVLLKARMRRSTKQCKRLAHCKTFCRWLCTCTGLRLKQDTVEGTGSRVCKSAVHCLLAGDVYSKTSGPLWSSIGMP